MYFCQAGVLFSIKNTKFWPFLSNFCYFWYTYFYRPKKCSGERKLTTLRHTSQGRQIIKWNEVVSPVEGGDGDDEEDAINEHEKKNRQMEVDSLGRVSEEALPHSHLCKRFL